MECKSAAEGGGQGLCVYLCDPSVPGWDRHFDGTGPLGFVGKTGAIVGVGIDCTGTFCEGEPASIAIKRARDSKLLCTPVALEGGVVTRKEDYWRKVKIKFDIEENKCDVTIGRKKVLDDIKFEGIQIPRTVCVGVCAGTQDGRNNHMCVNKLKLKSEDEDSESATVAIVDELLRLMDIDGDGTISEWELCRYYSAVTGKTVHSVHEIQDNELKGLVGQSLEAFRQLMLARDNPEEMQKHIQMIRTPTPATSPVAAPTVAGKKKKKKKKKKRHVTVAIVDELLRLMDIDGDGTISEWELCRYYSAVTGKTVHSVHEIQDNELKGLVGQSLEAFRQLMLARDNPEEMQKHIQMIRTPTPATSPVGSPTGKVRLITTELDLAGQAAKSRETAGPKVGPAGTVSSGSGIPFASWVELPWESVDTDKDGKISRQEWTASYGNDTAYDKYDLNKDGVIDREEYALAQGGQASNPTVEVKAPKVPDVEVKAPKVPDVEVKAPKAPDVEVKAPKADQEEPGAVLGGYEAAEMLKGRIKRRNDTPDLGSSTEFPAGWHVAEGAVVTGPHEEVVKLEEGAEVHLEAGAVLSVEAGAELKLEAGAGLVLQQGASLTVRENAELTVEHGAEFALRQDAELRLEKDAELKLEKDAELKLHRGTLFVMAQEAEAKLKKDSEVNIGSGTEFQIEGGAELELEEDAEMSVAHDAEIRLEKESRTKICKEVVVRLVDGSDLTIEAHAKCKFEEDITLTPASGDEDSAEEAA